jgi:hypothetical protein
VFLTFTVQSYNAPFGREGIISWTSLYLIFKLENYNFSEAVPIGQMDGHCCVSTQKSKLQYEDKFLFLVVFNYTSM